MSGPLVVPVSGGRVVAYDDVGDPGGRPVVFLHGTPDSRLARHPDDGLAAAAGVRLVAVDRPGYGGTSPGAGPGPGDFADDVAALLDGLGLVTAAVIAWSGGALDGLGLAASGRVSSLLISGGLVPVEAYADPDVRAVAEHRLALVEMAEDLDPGMLAESLAPMLAPHPCDHALAVGHQAEGRDPSEQSRLAAVPGGVDRMADALVEAVRSGLHGVEADVAAQLRPFPVDLRAVDVPVRLLYGEDDHVTPPAFGRWYAARLPHAELQVVPGAGHYLPFTHWTELLTP